MKVADAVAYVFIKNDVKRETAGSLNATDKLSREIATLQLSIRQLEEQRINYLKITICRSARLKVKTLRWNVSAL